MEVKSAKPVKEDLRGVFSKLEAGLGTRKKPCHLCGVDALNEKTIVVNFVLPEYRVFSGNDLAHVLHVLEEHGFGLVTFQVGAWSDRLGLVLIVSRKDETKEEGEEVSYTG
jgi:hypothetical protein